jgi:hypothetical protein
MDFLFSGMAELRLSVEPVLRGSFKEKETSPKSPP